jgi:hypothetical protein
MDNLHDDLEAFMHSFRTERAKCVTDYMLRAIAPESLPYVYILFLVTFLDRRTKYDI